MALVTAPDQSFEQTAPAASDSESLFEVLDGQRVELPPLSILAAVVASDIHADLAIHARSSGSGRSVVEALFHLPAPIKRNRRPDVAFVSYQRFPREQEIPPEDIAWDVVPDLAVEVFSPNDPGEEVMEMVGEYFRAGVRMVWVVYPRFAYVLAFESLTQVRGLTRSDTLDGGTVLPGFSLPLANLFSSPPTAGTVTPP
jgi:Uma2 family endonuclease